MKSICFTGHRKISHTEELKVKLRRTLIAFIENGCTDFYAGGAIGWDMLCEETVLALREEYPQIKLHLVLPCLPAEQTAKWSDPQKARFRSILTSADDVQYTAEHYSTGCMKRRNERLVELSECCICYCTDFKSGTGQTVRIAERSGINIYNLAK